MYLPDPRQFPRVDAKNEIIRQVMCVLTAREQSERDVAGRELSALLDLSLQQDDAAGLEQALQLSPAQEAYKYLWDELRELVESGGGEPARAVVFALPLLLVAAGVRGGIKVASQLQDIKPVLSILADSGVIASDREVGLSPVLLSLRTLQQWSLPQVARWVRHLKDAVRGVPVQLQPDEMVVEDEGVWLRFLVGVVIEREGSSTGVKLGGDASQWGLKLSEEINRQMKQDKLSIMAIPRPPQPLLQAMHSGRFARQEAGLQLMASRTIRKIRQAGETPVAVLASHLGDELRITISAKENSERWEGYVWPLHPLDSVELICDNVVALFRDCQVGDIRIVPEVQPDLAGDLPLFLRAQDTDASSVGRDVS